MSDEPTIKTALFYDQETGEITETTQGTMASFVADKRPYKLVDSAPYNIDSTHRIDVGHPDEPLIPKD